MNVLADTYIPDAISAYRIKLCGAWSLACVERRVQDRDEPDTPTS